MESAPFFYRPLKGDSWTLVERGYLKRVLLQKTQCASWRVLKLSRRRLQKNYRPRLKSAARLRRFAHAAGLSGGKIPGIFLSAKIAVEKRQSFPGWLVSPSANLRVWKNAKAVLRRRIGWLDTATFAAMSPFFWMRKSQITVRRRRESLQAAQLFFKVGL